MIDVLFKGGRKEDAMDLFVAIPANGLVPDVVTYRLIAENLIEEGSLEEFGGLFSAMEKSGTAPNSCTPSVPKRMQFWNSVMVLYIKFDQL